MTSHPDYNNDTIYRRTLYVGGGKWPLLTKQTFPFFINPKPVRGQADSDRFTDWGYQDGLVPTLAGVAGIIMFLTVHNFGGWGTGPSGMRGIILILVSLTLLLYGLIKIASVHTITIDRAQHHVTIASKLFATITLSETTYRSLESVEIAPGVISLTPTGMLPKKCFGVFLRLDNPEPIRRMVGCHTSPEDALNQAESLIESLNLTPDALSQGEPFTGRLPR